MYKHYCSIAIDIGLTIDDIVASWKQMKLINYHAWHVDNLIVTESDHEEDLNNTSKVDPRNASSLDEWELLSQMGVVGGENLNALEILAQLDFDNINNWDECSISPHLHNTIKHFISTNKTY